jgi:hypothetical protein
MSPQRSIRLAPFVDVLLQSLSSLERMLRYLLSKISLTASNRLGLDEEGEDMAVKEAVGVKDLSTSYCAEHWRRMLKIVP